MTPEIDEGILEHPSDGPRLRPRLGLVVLGRSDIALKVRPLDRLMVDAVEFTAQSRHPGQRPGGRTADGT